MPCLSAPRSAFLLEAEISCIWRSIWYGWMHGGNGTIKKLITGIGEPLTGSLLSMDLRDFQVMKTKIARRKDCTVCTDADFGAE